MKIHEALSAVMEEVGTVRKTGVNKSQHFNFRGIDAVTNAVSPILRKHGVVVRPTNVEPTYEFVTTKSGAVMTYARLKVTFTWTGPEGDSLETMAMGEAFDAGDKASPKAHSVAFRTAMLQTLCLPTDDPDPDEHSFERQAPAKRMNEVDLNAWIVNMNEADDLDTLKAEFTKAWDAASHSEDQQALTTAKDNRKAELEAVAK